MSNVEIRKVRENGLRFNEWKREEDKEGWNRKKEEIKKGKKEWRWNRKG